MPNPNASPLAQVIADTHNVDLATLSKESLGGKVTARQVLDYLDLTLEEKALLKRREDRLDARKSNPKSFPEKPSSDPKTAEGVSTITSPPIPTEPVEGLEPKAESESQAVQIYATEDTASAPKLEEKDASTPSGTEKSGQKEKALLQARSQLQATAMVHQKALMQVGSLRKQNEELDDEVARLRALEAQARDDLSALEARQQQLERELEQSRHQPKKFSWLRKLMS